MKDIFQKDDFGEKKEKVVVNKSLLKPKALLNILEDLEEEKRKLKKSEEKFRALFEGSVDAIFIADIKTKKIIDCNNEAVNLTGYSKEEILAMGPMDLIPPDKIEENERAFESHLSGKGVVLETEILKKDKKTRVPVLINASIINIGGKLYLQGVFRDFSEQKKAEEELRESEEQFQDLFSSMREGFALCEIILNEKGKPIDYRFIKINAAFGEQSGMDVKASIGKTIKEIYPDIEKIWIARYGKVAVTQKPIHFQDYNKNTKRYYDAVAFSPSKGKFAMLFKDITEEKKVEEGLKESEEKYRDLFYNVPVGFHVFGPDKKIIDINQAELGILGYTREEIVNKKTWEDLIIPEDKKQFQKHWKCILNNESVTDFEYTIVRKDGKKRVVILNASPRFDKSGKLINTRGSVVDITKRKKMERELRESEERFRYFFENIDPGVVYQDHDGKIISANSSAERILGLTISQMQGRESMDPRWKAIHEDGTEFLGETHPAMVSLKTGKKVSNVVMGVFHPKKNRYRWININATPVFKNKKMKPDMVFTVFEDITEKKRAEHEWEKLASVVRHTSELVNLSDVEGKMVFINSAGSKMLGIDPKDVGNYNVLEVIPEHFQEMVKAKLLPALIAGKSWEGELQYLNVKTKKLTDVHAITFSILDPKTKKVKYFANVSSDITEKKKVEDALRESEEKYKTLYNTASDAIMILEPPIWKFTGGNPATIKMFGCKDEVDFISRAPWQYSPKYQADGKVSKTKAMEMIDEAMKKGSSYFEWTHKRLNEENFAATVTLTKMKLYGRDVLQATVRDITEKKKAEEELKRYESIVASSSDMMALLNNDYVYLAVNDAYLKAFGLKKVDMIGKSVSEVFGKEFFEDVIQPQAEKCLRGVEVDYTDWFNFPVAGKKYMDIHYSPYIGVDKKVRGFVVIGRDTSGKKKAEDELKNLNVELDERVKERTKELDTQKQFYNSIVENIPHMIFVKDAKEFKFEEMNRAGELLLGLKKKDILGKNLLEKFSKSQSEFFLSKDRQVIKDGKLLDIPEEPIDTPHGLRTLHTKKIPLYNDEGEPEYLLGISEDITERKKVENQLKESYKKLKQLDVAKGDFLNTISHELKTPLTAMIAHLDVLGDVKRKCISRGTEQKQCGLSFDAIRRNNGQLNFLIDNLLEVARMQSKTFKLDFVEFDIRKLALDVINNFLPSATQRGLKIYHSIDKSLVLWADENRVREILNNLIDNAIKFTKKGKITVRIKKEEEFVSIIVEDSGIGIRKEDVPNLFKKFFQVHRGLKRGNAGGTGLGLTIVNNLAGLHGGNVSVKSQFGKGSTFTVKLPIKGPVTKKVVTKKVPVEKIVKGGVN